MNTAHLIQGIPMPHSTRSALAAVLIIGAACQPAPKPASETGMAGGESTTPTKLSSQDEAGVRAVDAEWARAATAGNGEAIAVLYTSDATLLPPNEPMVKGDGVRKYMTDFANGFTSKTELNTTAVEGSGDLAYAVGTYRMELTPKKAGAKPLPVDEGKYIEVMKRQDDGTWRIVYDIWNSNAPPAK
jgi:uncharacterized protein (TIGR02246 family)